MPALDFDRLDQFMMVSRQMQTLLKDEDVFGEGHPVDALLLRYIRFLRQVKLPADLYKERVKAARDLCRYARVYAKRQKYTPEETEAKLDEVMLEAEGRMRWEILGSPVALPEKLLVPPAMRFARPHPVLPTRAVVEIFPKVFDKWASWVNDRYPTDSLKAPKRVTRLWLSMIDNDVEVLPYRGQDVGHILMQLDRVSDQILGSYNPYRNKSFPLQSFLKKAESASLMRLLYVPCPPEPLGLPKGESKMPHP